MRCESSLVDILVVHLDILITRAGIKGWEYLCLSQRVYTFIHLGENGRRLSLWQRQDDDIRRKTWGIRPFWRRRLSAMPARWLQVPIRLPCNHLKNLFFLQGTLTRASLIRGSRNQGGVQWIQSDAILCRGNLSQVSVSYLLVFLQHL